MARLRKAKVRAQRIERGYYLRSHPIRRWRVILTLLALVVTGAWVWTFVERPDTAVASPGRLAEGHAMLEERCDACHADAATLQSDAARVQPVAGAAPQAPPRWHGSTQAACIGCHAVPDHHGSQIGTPSCADCHVEHRAAAELAAVSRPRCADCHGDLGKHMRGEPTLAREQGLRIDDFPKTHPEFAVWTGPADAPQRVRLDAGPIDPATLRLNHARHLKPIEGPPNHPRNDADRKVQMVCGDCHAGAGTPVQWPFGVQAPGFVPVLSSELAPAEEATYMAPVRYAQHCAACHPHNFADARFPDLPAPHDRPVVIRAFLRGLYSEWIVAHPDELGGPVRRRPIGEGATAGSTQSPKAWVDAQVAAAERVLFEDPKRCRMCHELTPGAGDLPVVTPTRVPVRWLPEARFDHGVHRLVTCDECHGAKASEKTSDVLMPRRDVCAKCHHAGGARDACAECHTYHGALTSVAMDGRLRIDQLAGNP